MNIVIKKKKLVRNSQATKKVAAPVKKSVKKVVAIHTEQKPVQKKILTNHKFQILTRHPSYAELRKNLPRMPFKLIARFGSTTEVADAISKGGKTLEINEIKAIRNSASKLLMKKCFTSAGVKTANWFTVRAGKICIADDQNKIIVQDKLPYPLIVKSHHGSRGEGNSFIKDQSELTRFMSSRDMSNYIIEEYMTSMRREYRLHINAINNTCFYTCRKLLKKDCPEENKFQKHSDTCIWAIESNPAFDRPDNWQEVVDECVKAIKSVGLDVGACDVIMQTSTSKKTGKKRDKPEFIICETCSAASMGNITTERYVIELPKIARQKAISLDLIKS